MHCEVAAKVRRRLFFRYQAALTFDAAASRSC